MASMSFSMSPHLGLVLWLLATTATVLSASPSKKPVGKVNMKPKAGISGSDLQPIQQSEEPSETFNIPARPKRNSKSDHSSYGRYDPTIVQAEPAPSALENIKNTLFQCHPIYMYIGTLASLSAVIAHMYYNLQAWNFPTTRVRRIFESDWWTRAAQDANFGPKLGPEFFTAKNEDAQEVAIVGIICGLFAACILCICALTCYWSSKMRKGKKPTKTSIDSKVLATPGSTVDSQVDTATPPPSSEGVQLSQKSAVPGLSTASSQGPVSTFIKSTYPPPPATNQTSSGSTAQPSGSKPKSRLFSLFGNRGGGGTGTGPLPKVDSLQILRKKTKVKSIMKPSAGGLDPDKVTIIPTGPLETGPHSPNAKLTPLKPSLKPISPGSSQTPVGPTTSAKPSTSPTEAKPRSRVNWADGK